MSDTSDTATKADSSVLNSQSELEEHSKKRAHDDVEDSPKDSESAKESIDSAKADEEKEEVEHIDKRPKSSVVGSENDELVSSTLEITAESNAEIGDVVSKDANTEDLPNQLSNSVEDIDSVAPKEDELTEKSSNGDSQETTKALDSDDKKEAPKTEEKNSSNITASYLAPGTTFKGGFGSFASSGFSASVSTTPATNSTSASKSTESTESAQPSIFSAGTTFKGGFSAFKSTAFSSASSEKKESFWATQDTKEISGEEKEDSEDSKSTNGTSVLGDTTKGDKLDMYVQVKSPLEQKKVETGEESEESVFTCRAKLYALDASNSSDGWKERGVGTLHVNAVKPEFEENYINKAKSRAVMRADGILKVILNVPINKNTEIMSGMKSSLSSEKFVRITAFEDGRPFQYSLRTGSADTAKKLYEVLKKQIPSA